MASKRRGTLQLGLRIAFVASVAAVLASGCTTTGVGGGEVVRAGEPQGSVQFTWQSKDGGVSGTMTATLENQTFDGRFFQITQETERTSLGPLWIGFRQGRYDWPYGGFGGGFGPYDDTQFVTHYTGRVVANLGAPDGQRMRCRLQLVRPSRGMAGGGEGECQLNAGRTVDARF